MDKTIITKQPLYLHIAESYVQMLIALGGYLSDKKFKKLVDELESYISVKLKPDGDSEIVDFYVAAVQRAD